MWYLCKQKTRQREFWTDELTEFTQASSLPHCHNSVIPLNSHVGVRDVEARRIH